MEEARIVDPHSIPQHAGVCSQALTEHQLPRAIAWPHHKDQPTQWEDIFFHFPSHARYGQDILPRNWESAIDRHFADPKPLGSGSDNGKKKIKMRKEVATIPWPEWPRTYYCERSQAAGIEQTYKFLNNVFFGACCKLVGRLQRQLALSNHRCRQKVQKVVLGIKGTTLPHDLTKRSKSFLLQYWLSTRKADKHHPCLGYVTYGLANYLYILSCHTLYALWIFQFSLNCPGKPL